MSMKTDIRTTYMGLPLKSPLLVSASPLAREVDNFLKMEDAGAGAAVMFSLFEEQIEAEAQQVQYLWEAGAESFGEALNYFPEVDSYPVGVAQYMEILQQASKRCDMPIIGSLNGIHPEGWVELAQAMEAAGASGIELNVFFIPTFTLVEGNRVEAQYIEALTTVKEAVNIPVAIKLNPYFSAMGNMAKKLSEAGADALVMFNRFYQPDFDIESMEILNSLELSQPHEIRLPLMWIGILYDKFPLSLAASTGVHSGTELIKYLLAGADVAMTTSALLKHGIGHIRTMLDELTEWMEARSFDNLEEIRGIMSQQNIRHPEKYERANYIKILHGYEA